MPHNYSINFIFYNFHCFVFRTQEIIQKYPEYIVRFYGIGPGPDGSENLGCCSQMAVFQKNKDSEEAFITAREFPEVPDVNSH